MPPPDSAEFKRNLRAAGFEIYRTTSAKIQIAERIRDNLIMDSGITAQMAETGSLGVQVIVRAQASHFPGATEDLLWRHARSLAQPFIDAEFTQTENNKLPVPDPSAPGQSLDVSYEVHLFKDMGSDWEALFDAVRHALARPRSTSDE